MKIVIAHPSAAAELGVELDTTTEAPDDVAARMIADGFARVAETKSRSPKSTDTEGA